MITLCCDVGTSSVRVALFEYFNSNTLNTTPLAVAIEPLPIHNRKSDFYEQNTKEIWSAFCKCTGDCLQKSGLNLFCDHHDKFPIDAMAFSATCSLVIVEDNISEENDVLMWMDHRAKSEAESVNQTNHQVLNQFGGICSPEFSLAKLLWLHRNQPNRFKSANAFMELSDWLTYKCSEHFGSPELFPRSLCCVTCKWGYDALNNKWPQDLFNHLGIKFDTHFEQRIGKYVVRPGVKIGSLRVSVAKKMGFKFDNHNWKNKDIINSVAISSSLIDAHSGVISMLVLANSKSDISEETSKDYENVLCMISGTSTCHMILNKTCNYTKGVWGPYWDVIIPGHYLREAGQSATGKLIEHVLTSYHLNHGNSLNINDLIVELNKQLQEKQFIHRTSLIVNPTFHGNRSPIANPHLKGAIYGLTLEQPTLIDLYAATMEAIAYETKYIVDEIENGSNSIRKIVVSGGLTKNDFYLQLHADILNHELVTFSAGDANLMLVGASVIAFTAHQNGSTDDKHQIESILNSINFTTQQGVRVFRPRTQNTSYHTGKYSCYRKLLDCCLQMEDILDKKVYDNNGEK